MRAKLTRLGSTVVLVGLLASLFGSAVASAVTPAQRLASVIAAVRTAKSVHYVSSSIDSGTRAVIVGNASTTIGVQQITYEKGGRTGHATIIATNKAAYLMGDAFMLQSYLKFPAADARKYASKWLRYAAGGAAYTALAQDVLLSTLVDEFKLGSPLTGIGAAKIDGTSVFALEHTATSAQAGTVVTTLYSSAAGAPLPVELLIKEKTGHVKAVFSAWNKGVAVNVPSSPTPAAGAGGLIA